MSLYDRYNECVRTIESLEQEAQDLVRSAMPDTPVAVDMLPHCLLIQYSREPIGEDILLPARQRISQLTGYPFDTVEICYLEPIPEGGQIITPEDRQRKKQSQN